MEFNSAGLTMSTRGFIFRLLAGALLINMLVVGLSCYFLLQSRSFKFEIFGGCMLVWPQKRLIKQLLLKNFKKPWP